MKQLKVGVVGLCPTRCVGMWGWEPPGAEPTCGAFE